MSYRDPTQKTTAELLDRQDGMRTYRSRFINREPDLIYMDGNSLGRLPALTGVRINTVIEDQWGKNLVRSWGGYWVDAPQRVGEKIAALIGAAPGQTIISDSTSVNLFKLAMAVLQLQGGRSKIISDALNFPSDLYILQGCIQLLNQGHTLKLIPSKDTISVDLATLYDAIDEQTALVTLSHVAFKSGYLYDVEAITKHAHQAGALVLWDLSHSVGAIPIQLDTWNVDLAIGCTYKYLNGGPGAPAFLYVRKDLQDAMVSPIWGWFGQNMPFAFDLEYKPAGGITHFLCGTPPILSLLAMEAGLDPILEAGIDAIRSKSIQLTSFLLQLFDTKLAPRGFTLGSPRDADRRGSHISIRHPDGYRINRALIEAMQVIPDFREPDNIRLGLSPLYTSFTDVWEAVERISRVIDDKIHLRFSVQRQIVT